MSSEFPTLIGVEKTISVRPKWVDAENVFNLVVPLSVGLGIVGGLQLRAKAFIGYPDMGVTVQIEHVPIIGRPLPLCRYDWKPFHVHNNKGRGPEYWRFKDIAGTHFHAFNLNWDFEGRRMLRANLPIALPATDDPATFPKLIRVLSEEFQIENLFWIPTPPWSPQTGI